MEALFKLSVMINMIDNITEPARVASGSVDQMTSHLQSLNQGFSNMTKGGMVLAGVGKQLTMAALAPVGAVFETKKALGELASLGIENLKALEEASLDFSNTWAGTTKAEFITAAYDIKSGIASLSDEAVAEFTNIAGITAKGTKSSIAEMTDLFATGYGIYKDYYKDLSDIEFGEIFSAGIAKSVQQFKTDGSKMAQSIQTLGASATTSNVPLEEQLSILGMLQATMGGAEAGTKYKAFLQSAAKAGETLKLSFTDANNQLLSMPEILAQLRGKFGETMDAAEKMKLQEAFGTAEAVALIDLLYGKTGELESNILTLYDTMGQGTAVAEGMANAINSTEGEQFDVLKQKIQNTVETIGNGMLPTINKWLDKGASLLEQVSNWVANNQELAGSLGIAVVIIGMLLTAIGVGMTIFGAFGTVITGTIMNARKFALVLKGIPGAFETLQIKALYAGDAIKAGWMKIKGVSATVISSIRSVSTNILTMAKTAAINGFTALKSMALGLVGMAKQAIITAATAMPGLIASVWSFTTALLANPITWIVVGIVALIAALILLWQNWDTVVAWIQNVWNGAVQVICNTWNSLVGAISSIGSALVSSVSNIWNSITSSIANAGSTLFNTVITIWSNIKSGVTGFITSWIPNMLESGKKVISTFCEGIRSMINKPVEIVKSGLAKVRQLLPFSDAKEGPLSQLTLSGSKIFTTIGEGMERTLEVPKALTQKAFMGVEQGISEEEQFKQKVALGLTSDSKEKYKVSLNEITTNTLTGKENSKDTQPCIRIGKLIIQADLKQLEDLKILQQLAKEFKDQDNKELDSFEEDDFLMI